MTWAKVLGQSMQVSKYAEAQGVNARHLEQNAVHLAKAEGLEYAWMLQVVAKVVLEVLEVR